VTNQLFACSAGRNKRERLDNMARPTAELMTNLLFGFRGRITRAKFWLVALAIFVVELILFAALGGNAAMWANPQAALAAIGPVAGALCF
jgi:uncharacterized membrane protein YhaH (DUF805 family)